MNRDVRVTVGLAAFAAALGAAIWRAGGLAKASLAKRYPAPGCLVDVGGRRRHLHCSGREGPTVILEAGLNDFSVVWTDVQREAAAFARVCSYDRAGLGWSERGLLPRTGTAMVRELHDLLGSANVRPPYVLVGHSFGGALVRLYAREYPDEVTGLVLVDAAHEDLFSRIPAWQVAVETGVRQFGKLAWLSARGWMALRPATIPNRGFPNGAIERYRAVLATTGYFDAAREESLAFESILEELRAAPALPSRDLPLVVISRGRWGSRLKGLSQAENQQAWQTWQQLQAGLVRLSTRARHLVAERSDHDIPLQQPQLVADAIRQLVRDVRS